MVELKKLLKDLEMEVLKCSKFIFEKFLYAKTK